MMLGVKSFTIMKDYTIERNLGFGTYGEIKLGIQNKTKVLVAIKKRPLGNITDDQKNMIFNEI